MRYFDNAATSPVRPEVVAAMHPFARERFGNAASVHGVGHDAAVALADARGRAAAVLGVRAGDIVFTSGGTESNNLAIIGLSLGARGRRSGHVVTTAIEHHSVLGACDYLARLHGYDVTVLAVDGEGRVEADAVAASVRDDTTVVALAQANNEIGTVRDVAAIAAALRPTGVPLHVDAVQSAGWLPLHGLGADSIAVAGHKIGAPKGTGLLAVRARLPLEPLFHGGDQERGRRAGTVDVAGAVGLAVALELAERDRERSADWVRLLRDEFVRRVLLELPTARLTGPLVQRHPASASFVFPGVSGEAVLLELERRGLITSSGSACAAGSSETSHVLRAIGLDDDTARTAVRFTFGHELEGDVTALVASLVASHRGVTDR